MKQILPRLLLPTTVVGSYPVEKGKGFSGLLDPYRQAVKSAVSDQVSAGIDIISDGQVREDMVKIFTSFLPGIRGREVIGPVQPAPGPITLTDIRYALSQAPRVKGIITGPTTLSFALQLKTSVYRNREELALDLARALAVEARALQDAGVAIIQVDEPILSTGTASLDAARDALAVLTRDITLPTGLHMCGTIAGSLDRLIEMPVDILDFEFAKSPENLDQCREYDLSEKWIGFGCVDSTRSDVEDVAEIRTRIENGLRVFDPGQLLVDPDCGLRMLDRRIAFEKLSRMVRAVKELRDQF